MVDSALELRILVLDIFCSAWHKFLHLIPTDSEQNQVYLDNLLDALLLHIAGDSLDLVQAPFVS